MQWRQAKRWLSIGLTIGLLALSGSAAADSHMAGESAAASPAATPAAAEATPPTAVIPPLVPYPPLEGATMADAARYPSLDVPTVGWKYDNTYIFAATRGLFGGEPTVPTKKLSGLEQGFSMIGTIPADLIALIGAAFAGLWGS
jgi:hypothetical protein